MRSGLVVVRFLRGYDFKVGVGVGWMGVGWGGLVASPHIFICKSRYKKNLIKAW